MDLDSTYTVNYPGCFLYANGGRVEGTVYVGTNKIGTKNNYLDSVKATNAIDHTDGKPTTVFTGDVSCEGDIRGGIFHGSVTVLDPRDDMADVSKYNYWKFCSNLSGGSFYKPGPHGVPCLRRHILRRSDSGKERQAQRQAHEHRQRAY